MVIQNASTAAATSSGIEIGFHLNMDISQALIGA